MSAPLVFVDTPVFLHTADERDLDKQARAREWVRWCWTERCGRISTQVLNELYHNAITRFRARMPVQQARAAVRNLRHWQPPHLEINVIDGAWALQDSHGLDYWDALIVSSAQAQGCHYLLSEDLPHQQRFESVQVINPFLVRPGGLPPSDEA